MFKRALAVAMVPALMIAALAGCSDSSDSTTDPQPTARMRIVHASPDFGEVDVYLEGAAVPWLSGFDYLDTSTFLTVASPVTIVLNFRRAGDPADAAPLFTTDPLELVTGSSTSAVVCGLEGSGEPADQLRFLPYADSWLAHGTGETRVRIIHAGVDADDLTVAIADGPVLAEDLGRFDASTQGGEPYPSDQILEINIFGIGGGLSFLVPALDGDQDYYFVLTGLVASAGADAFTLLPVGPGGSMDLETEPEGS